MDENLYVVSDDPKDPSPVDMTRLQEALGALEYRVDVVEEGKALGALFDGIPMLFSFDNSGRFLSIRAVWDTGVEPGEATQLLFAAADNWNREKYFPTVYTVRSPENSAQVCADFIVDTRAGLNGQQLSDSIQVGLSTGTQAIEFMQESAGPAIGWTPNALAK